MHRVGGGGVPESRKPPPDPALRCMYLCVDMYRCMNMFVSCLPVCAHIAFACTL